MGKGFYFGILTWVLMHVSVCGQGIYRSYENFKKGKVDYPVEIKKIYTKSNGLVEVKTEGNRKVVFERDSVYGFDRAGKKFVRVGNYFAEVEMKERLSPILVVKDKERDRVDDRLTKMIDRELFVNNNFPSQFQELFLLDVETGQIIRIDRLSLEEKYKEVPQVWEAYLDSDLPKSKRYKAFIPKYNDCF